MSRWSKFNSLPWRDRYRLASFILLLPLAALALRLFGFRRLYSFISAHPQLDILATRIDPSVIESCRQTAYLVSVASRYSIYHATCLSQSILLFWLLRLQGIPSELRIGVQTRSGKVLAHAWVRIAETVISEGEQVEDNFKAFEGISIPSRDDSH